MKESFGQAMRRAGLGAAGWDSVWIMADCFEMKVIARVRSEFPEKFGIPRQSNLISELKSTIVFEPEYRDPNALKGLEEYSHLWLIWVFSESIRSDWSPMVRPPRLGGNVRCGVFASRSPFRPNPVGLSVVKIEAIRKDPKLGMVIDISGADLMDQTPILDIKPYLPHTESIPDAMGGFAVRVKDEKLSVLIPKEEEEKIRPEKRETLKKVLEQDPRPHYQKNPERLYGMTFADYEIHFRVEENTLIVCKITKAEEKKNGANH